MAHSKSLKPADGWKWEVCEEYADSVRHIMSALEQTREYIERSVDGISYDDLWKRPGPDMASMGNILMHLQGTEHQWIGNKIGGNPLVRNRPLEFSTEAGEDADVLLEKLRKTADETREVLKNLNEVAEDILFCLHYTENHFAFHAGQLVLMRKIVEPGFTLY